MNGLRAGASTGSARTDALGLYGNYKTFGLIPGQAANILTAPLFGVKNIPQGVASEGKAQHGNADG
jgi:hypothetical protein